MSAVRCSGRIKLVGMGLAVGQGRAALDVMSRCVNLECVALGDPIRHHNLKQLTWQWNGQELRGKGYTGVLLWLQGC